MPVFTWLNRNALPVIVVPAGRFDCAATDGDCGLTSSATTNSDATAIMRASRRMCNSLDGLSSDAAQIEHVAGRDVNRNADEERRQYERDGHLKEEPTDQQAPDRRVGLV